MFKTTVAAVIVLGALGAVSAPAATKVTPMPTATPLKTITHLHVSPLCTGLRRNIGPAIGKVLQNDKLIATSRPLFRSFVKNNAASSQAGQDLDMMRMERLIGPMVQNTEAIKKLLADPYVFPKHANSDGDKELLDMRNHLQSVLSQQERVLDVISGFVDTQQLGELQAAGHEYDSAINGSETQSNNGKNVTPPSQNTAGRNLAPTPPPAAILNAGVPNQLQQQNDPRFKSTGNTLGYNPLNAFEGAIAEYQQQIDAGENTTAQLVMKAVPQCGGAVPKPTPTP